MFTQLKRVNLDNMKAVRFIIPKTSEATFRLQEDHSAYFYDSIHYHPEYQLTLVLKGEGTCFIGNSVERYKPGDVFLIGKNVPHVFRSDQEYYNEGAKLESHCVSIFLNDETLGKQFLDLPELVSIHRLLESSQYGIYFPQKENEKISNQILHAFEIKDFERFLHIINLFHYLSCIENIQLLSTTPFFQPSKETDHERINVIFQHLSLNFANEITLEEVAQMANMTTNSFCRYFKKRTGKSFSHFLNNLRIEYACHMIANSNEAFGSIAMDCGYNSLSYFNRQFKNIKKLTPNQYRIKYAGNITN